MGLASTALQHLQLPPNWGADWAWGLPLIVLTVIIHVLGLGIIHNKLISRGLHPRSSTPVVFVAVMSATTLLVACLHGLETVIWAAAYRINDAALDNKSAMLYSLNAMTTYGHASVELAPQWQLMGALEALNGWLLFGLTTAFLFAVIQQWWFGTPDRWRNSDARTPPA